MTETNYSAVFRCDDTTLAVLDCCCCCWHNSRVLVTSVNTPLNLYWSRQ